MSKRVVITILVLLLLPVFIGPIVIGVMLERGVEQVVEATDESVLQIEFDRGLYSSRAVTRIVMQDASGQRADLVAEHVIVHGPIPLAAPAIGRSPLDLVIVLVHSRIDADPEAMPSVAEALAGDALATVITRVTSVGDVDAKVDAPGFELEGGRLIWAGLVGNLTLRESGRELAGRFESDGVRLADADMSLTLHEGWTEFDADLVERRIHVLLEQTGAEWVALDRRLESGPIRIEGDQPIGGDLLGDAQSVWMITKLSSVGALGEPEFELAGLKIEQAVSQDAASGLHRAELGVSFDRWQVGDAPADGPGGFTAVLDRIDGPAVQRFRVAMQALEQSGKGPAEIKAMRPFIVLEQMPALLTSSPAFDVRDGFVKGPEGRLEGEMQLTVDGSQPELLSDPFMMMSLITAHAKLDGPEALVRRMADRFLPTLQTAPPVVAAAGEGTVVSDPEEPALPEPSATPPPEPVDRIDAWLADGTLVRDGDQLHFEAHFEDGLPVLNGQPADPAIFMNLMPGM